MVQTSKCGAASTPVLLLGLLLSASAALAQTCESEDEFKTCLPDWAVGRFNVITNDTVAIPDRDVEETSRMLDIVARPFFRKLNGSKPPCNTRDSTWTAGVVNFFKLRTLGEVSDTCLSSYKVSDDVSSIVSAIRGVQDISIRQFQPYLNEIDATELFAVGRWKFEDFESQTCELEKITLAKVEDQWALLLGPTNAEASETLADRQRQYLNALFVINVDEREFTSTFQAENIAYRIATAGDFNEEENKGPLGIGTVAREQWAGIPGVSSVIDMPPAQNPAILAMLDNNDQDAELAMETLLPSNVAILALPMIINLVPSSALKLKSWRSIIVYVLVTDFVTTIPFMIKGVELIVQATKTSSTAVAYHLGDTDGNQHLEIWAGSCSLTQSTTPGIVFLVVGFLVLLTGIIVEIFTHKREEVKKVTRGLSLSKSLSRRRTEDVENADDDAKGDDGEDLDEDDEANHGHPRTANRSWLPF